MLKTIRKKLTASGPPSDKTRLVQRMKIVDLFLRPYRSLAASDAEVDEAGYSPPRPIPVAPRAIFAQDEVFMR